MFQRKIEFLLFGLPISLCSLIIMHRWFLVFKYSYMRKTNATDFWFIFRRLRCQSETVRRPSARQLRSRSSNRSHDNCRASRTCSTRSPSTSSSSWWSSSQCSPRASRRATSTSAMPATLTEFIFHIVFIETGTLPLALALGSLV